MADVTSVAVEMALKNVLIRVLNSPEARKIDFFIGYLHVNWTGYLAVLQAVTEGRITMRTGDLPDDVAAQYIARENYFLCPNRPFGLQQSDWIALLHEATHAAKSILYSFKANLVVSDTLDEAAAYVADALYNIYLGSPVPSSILVAPHDIKAAAIAASIQNQPGAFVPAQDADQLRAFIAMDPVYSRMNVDFLSAGYR